MHNACVQCHLSTQDYALEASRVLAGHCLVFLSYTCLTLMKTCRSAPFPNITRQVPQASFLRLGCWLGLIDMYGWSVCVKSPYIKWQMIVSNMLCILKCYMLSWHVCVAYPMIWPDLVFHLDEWTVVHQHSNTWIVVKIRSSCIMTFYIDDCDNILTPSWSIVVTWYSILLPVTNEDARYTSGVCVLHLNASRSF